MRKKVLGIATFALVMSGLLVFVKNEATRQLNRRATVELTSEETRFLSVFKDHIWKYNQIPQWKEFDGKRCTEQFESKLLVIDSQHNPDFKKTQDFGRLGATSPEEVKTVLLVDCSPIRVGYYSTSRGQSEAHQLRCVYVAMNTQSKEVCYAKEPVLGDPPPRTVTYQEGAPVPFSVVGKPVVGRDYTWPLLMDAIRMNVRK